MSYPGWRARDRIAPAFRFQLLDALGIVPYYHQAELFAYLDQKALALDSTCTAHDIKQPRDTPQLRTWIDGIEHWLVAVPRFVELEIDKYGEKVMEDFPARYEDGETPIVDHLYFATGESERPRPQVLAASCSFKAGKSVVGGLIPSSFGATPELKWDLWGLEYDICEPELDYILEAFLSESGLNLPLVKQRTGNELVGHMGWKSDPQMGRMYLRLSNGAEYRCRSFRKAMETKSDPLKGKERDGFSVCEVYQFPSIQSLMSYRQNLAIRRGYYIMPSTPDRPIMDDINKRCDPENDEYPTWLGVKNIHRRENPLAFVMDDYLEDLKTFTREEFTVYWEGRSGRWIGAVYPPVKFFDCQTHPEFWTDPEGEPTLENFAPPAWLSRRGGADTATLYSMSSALSDDKGETFFIHSACNYRYVTGQIEQRHEVTIETLCSEVRAFREIIGGKWGRSYTDHNTQWKNEFKNEGCPLRKGQKDPEVRCEATRAMMQNGMVWFAPWMRDSALVTEFEIAKYPPKELSTRKRKRIDEKDHSLDGAEHICAMHPKARRPTEVDPANPIRALLASRRKRPSNVAGDPQIGA